MFGAGDRLQQARTASSSFRWKQQAGELLAVGGRHGGDGVEAREDQALLVGDEVDVDHRRRSRPARRRARRAGGRRPGSRGPALLPRPRGAQVDDDLRDPADLPEEGTEGSLLPGRMRTPVALIGEQIRRGPRPLPADAAAPRVFGVGGHGYSVPGQYCVLRRTCSRRRRVVPMVTVPGRNWLLSPKSVASILSNGSSLSM